MIALHRRRRVLLAPALLVLAVPALVSCGSDQSTTGGGSAAEAVATPSGSPFDFDITGPQTARPGETVPVTLTNTGRLPDGYFLVSDPAGAATIDQPELSLGPGEAGTVGVTVRQVPFIIRVQRISSGGSQADVYLSVGKDS